MTDTHRKPRLEIITRADGRNVYHDADKLDQAEAEARNPRDLESRYGRAGDLTGKVRDALNTQTTLPNSVDWRESVASALIGLRTTRVAGNHTEAPWGWFDCYIEALEDVADTLGLPNDSGKSGTTAANLENGSTGSPDVRNDAVRPEKLHLPEPHVFRFDEAAHFAAVGALKEEGEGEPDPTPEQQAETFQAIAAAPRPTAVEIKHVLERVAYHGERFFALGFPSQATDMELAAKAIDSLGVHCLALEIERDGLAAQLDRIADRAKPIDGTELAELVQSARVWLDRNPRSSTPSRAATDLIEDLVAAVNDQGRRLREAETVQHPATAELLAKSAELIQGHVSNIAGMQPDKSDLVACLSRTRWALIQAMNTGTEAATLLAEAQALIDESRPVVKWVEDIASMTEPDIEFGDLGAVVATARGTFQDPPRQVRYYSLEQERDAVRALACSEAALPPRKWEAMVPFVAEALGLVRAR